VPGRLYQAGKLEPVAGIGEWVALLAGSGLLDTNPFRQVQFVEPVFGLGTHGATILWSATGTPPAGYGSALPPGAATGTISPGQQTSSSPSVFQLGANDLLQLRWLVHPINLPAGVAAQDIDVMLSLPSAVQRFTVLNTQSRINLASQIQLPGDATSLPLQGSNYSPGTPAPALSPPDWSNLTEIWVFEQTYLPTWTIVNNGSNALNQGAIALNVYGFRYSLLPPVGVPSDWVQRQVVGKGGLTPAPREFVYIPIAGRAPGQGRSV
jgi:hypothetical protein